MHLSTLVLRVQFEDWFQVKAGFNQKDTPKRRKGLALSHWISSKRLALWSYGISLFKQNMSGLLFRRSTPAGAGWLQGGRAALRSSRMDGPTDLSLLEARVALLLARLWSAFPGCQMNVRILT